MDVLDETTVPSAPCYLLSLPSELIDSILSWLPPVDLAAVSATCRALRVYATSDLLWQARVQDNVPGVRVTSPYPCPSYRDLYVAHEPRWFLPKYKIWFSDVGLTGRLILVRYDQRRGCIEGYQMLATNRPSEGFQLWDADDRVIIHPFEPVTTLHLDKPILHLAPQTDDNDFHTEDSYTHFQTAAGSSRHNRGEESQDKNGDQAQRSHFRTELPMRSSRSGISGAILNSFIYARPLSPEEVQWRTYPTSASERVWPPRTIEAPHRVAGASLHRVADPPLGLDGSPTRRRDISDRAFRIRTALEIQIAATRVAGLNVLLSVSAMGQALGQNLGGPHVVNLNVPVQLGPYDEGEIETYATMDPALYTPTPTKPYRGIWVGDYSGHGCEFLLINQPDDEEDAEDSRRKLAQMEGETDEEFAQRKRDDMVYRGRLEAIKLTGDPNVPRGEYTFVVDDLGDGGLVKVLQDDPFAGARVVKSRGHVANTGFVNGMIALAKFLLHQYH